MLPILFLSACRGYSLPLGTWRINGDNEIGFIRHSMSGWNHKIELAIFSEHASTNGIVEAHLDSQDGIHWFRFPIETGFGTGKASLRLQGKEAYLPMGARVNEFGLRMRAEKDGVVSEEELNQAHAAWMSRQAADQEAWMQGSFVLYSDTTPVGMVQLIPEEPAEVQVFDSFWLSEGRVQAERLDEGPDILLLFPVEPSLDGEDGLLRMNTILQEVVVPMADVPSDLDRRLWIKPGTIDEAELNRHIEVAIKEADRLERELVIRDGIQLARWAERTEGCASFDNWVMNSSYDWMGYHVSIDLENDECVVSVKSDPEQHRRRFSGKITKNGLIEAKSGD